VYPALLPLMPHTSAASSRLNWRPSGADLNGLANAVGSQYSSHYLGTWCIQHYYLWCRTPRLPAVDWTDAPPADLNGLVRFARKTKSGFCAFAIAFQLASMSCAFQLTVCRPTRPTDRQELHVPNVVYIQYTSWWLLCYKSEGLCFDPSCCHWNFSLL